jgi:hypothetical protein
MQGKRYFNFFSYASSYDEIIPVGSFKLEDDGSGLKFIVYYARKGKIVGVCSLANDPVVSHASELMRIGIYIIFYFRENAIGCRY